MTRKQALRVMLYVASGMLSAGAMVAQRPQIGNWSAPGNDPGHTGWQRAETTLTKEDVPTKFKFLWKIKLGAETEDMNGFSEPLLAPRLINGQGFKDFVYVASPDTLYAVDSELGKLLWKKTYDAPKGSGACGRAPLGLAMEPPVVINFGARRAPGQPAPAPVPIPTASERRLGAAAGGGGFTFRGIYALTSDGMLHEQVLTTGADYAPAVKFLPAAQGGQRNINIVGKTVFTETAKGCGGSTDALWALNIGATDYPVKSFALNGAPMDVMGPAAEADTAYIVTGDGGGADAHPNSVVALGGSGLAASDWYTPASGKLANVAPVAFTYKGKHLIAAPGADGSVVLLDAASLGGSDHHTALAQSDKGAGAAAGAWGGLATWADSDGSTYVYAAIASAKGALTAYKIDDASGKLSLKQVWASSGLVNPAPPAIGNGVLVVLSQGDAKTHAKVLALDAVTGKQLFTSGDTIPTYAHMAGVAMGDGHVFFTTHDNTLYSFGIGIEH